MEITYHNKLFFFPFLNTNIIKSLDYFSTIYKFFLPDQKCVALKAPYAPIYELCKLHNTEELRKLLIEAPKSELYYNLFKNKCDQIYLATNLRLVVAEADGTVAYDSSKENNTFINFKSKTINENHNTRPAFMVAQLSKSGVGTAYRYSTSVNANEINVAVRIVDSAKYYPGLDAGAFRLSSILLQ